MNPLVGHGIGVMIVVLMLVFIGIWIWAWRPGHAATFSRLARIPMQDPPCDDLRDEDAEP